jgi:hypothetical protein
LISNSTPPHFKNELTEKFNTPNTTVYITVTNALGQEQALEYRETTGSA